MDIQDPVSKLLTRLEAGEPRAVARALRYIDADATPHLSPLLHGIYRLANARSNHELSTIGITGAPGAGKSSLLDAWIGLCRKNGLKVGVIAVDPSSPLTGGAVLGDRIRMQHHFLDDGVFIRSLANRGAHGGLSTSTQDAVMVMLAAGFDRVFVETVGVGQGEFDVTDLVDVTVLVMPPGLGDDIQAIKAGVLEVADIFVVNKADKDGALMAVRDLEMMIQLGLEVSGRHRDGVEWVPPVLKTIATRQEGLIELEDECRRYKAWLSTSQGQKKKQAHMKGRLKRMVERGIWQKLDGFVEHHIEESVQGVIENKLDFVDAADALIQRAIEHAAGVRHG